MSKMKYLPAMLLIAACLSACEKTDTPNDQETNADNQVTETVLDDVDAIEGTISDAMINVEELDNSQVPETAEDDSTENNDAEQAEATNEESE